MLSETEMKNKEEISSATISELKKQNASLQEKLDKEESEKLVRFHFVVLCCDISSLFLAFDFDFMI